MVKIVKFILKVDNLYVIMITIIIIIINIIIKILIIKLKFIANEVKCKMII